MRLHSLFENDEIYDMIDLNRNYADNGGVSFSRAFFFPHQIGSNGWEVIWDDRFKVHSIVSLDTEDEERDPVVRAKVLKAFDYHVVKWKDRSRDFISRLRDEE